ncbi:hypothetical protein NL676_008480 [Syzygium grande]|nr:hypothetical protein NL676_008480 [Syzygium grande]
MARHRWPRLALSRSLSFSSNMSIYQRGRGGDVEIGSVRFQGQESRRDSGDGERGEKTGCRDFLVPRREIFHDR